MNEEQKAIAERFNNRGIWYIAALAIVFDSVQAGILLSQLLYWHDKGHKDDFWVYKTVEELHIETGLKRSGQETAIKRLVAWGILEVKLAGIPATRHFRLDIDHLNYLLDGLRKDSNLVSNNTANLDVDSQQSITENTFIKSTQETTHDSELEAELRDFDWKSFVPP